MYPAVSFDNEGVVKASAELRYASVVRFDGRNPNLISADGRRESDVCSVSPLTTASARSSSVISASSSEEEGSSVRRSRRSALDLGLSPYSSTEIGFTAETDLGLYCDGASFAGDRAEPLQVADPANPGRTMPLYFRGRRLLAHLIDHLVSSRGMGAATHVMLSGGSAGGLAAYLAADALGEYLAARAPLVKYRAVPVSGFFAMEGSVTSARSYFVSDMRAIYELHNCSAGTPAKCRASLPAAERWRCFFANYSYASSSTPFFPLQSAADLYQLQEVARVGDAADGCLNSTRQFAGCNASQVRAINAFSAELTAELTRTAKHAAAGEGGWLDSCLEHEVAAAGGSSSSAFDKYTIANVSMRDALARWWHADGRQPASAHWSMPCALSQRPPHQCNPSCYARQ